MTDAQNERRTTALHDPASQVVRVDLSGLDLADLSRYATTFTDDEAEFTDHRLVARVVAAMSGTYLDVTNEPRSFGAHVTVLTETGPQHWFGDGEGWINEFEDSTRSWDDLTSRGRVVQGWVL